MAEAIFSHLVEKEGLGHAIRVDSAGTANYHVGGKPDSRSVACCNSHGVKVNHRARQLTTKDFDDFDYILVMDGWCAPVMTKLGRRFADAESAWRFFQRIQSAGRKTDSFTFVQGDAPAFWTLWKYWNH